MNKCCMDNKSHSGIVAGTNLLSTAINGRANQSGISIINDNNGLTTLTGNNKNNFTLTGIVSATDYVDDFLCYKTLPPIKKVIFQKAHTIIVWKDKTESTVVKCSEEEFDEEKGLAMAICKKLFKRNEFKKLIENADHQDK